MRKDQYYTADRYHSGTSGASMAFSHGVYNVISPFSFQNSLSNGFVGKLGRARTLDIFIHHVLADLTELCLLVVVPRFSSSKNRVTVTKWRTRVYVINCTRANFLGKWAREVYRQDKY